MRKESMKMLKELKGKRVQIVFLPRYDDVIQLMAHKYKLEDYCEMPDGLWIKLRSSDNLKEMTWQRFSQVEIIGRVP